MQQFLRRLVSAWCASLATPLLVGLAISGFAPPSSAFVQGPPAAVRVDAVREELLVERRSVTGDLRAARRVEVATREKGLVLEFAAREGQVVKKGAVLAKLDSQLLELELATIRANDVPARAKVQERESDLAQANRDLSTVKALLDRNAANPKEVEDRTSEVAAATARLEESRGQLAVLSAQAKTLEKRISNTVIAAPFAGTVTQRRTEMGAWLSEGDAVVELVSTNDLEVWLEVPQDLFGALQGFAGSIDVEVGGSGANFSITNITVVPEIDPRARAFRIFGPVNSAWPLAAGMSVRASVPTAKQKKMLTIHRDAILRNEVGSFVYAVIPGAEGQPSNAAPMAVEILFQTGERAVVRAGSLQVGMQVVVEGNERLYPMAPIQPLPANGKGPKQ